MRLIKKKYINHYNDIFLNELGTTPLGTYDESALPSYTHKNRMMSWLFWKRIDTAFSIAGTVKNKSVLDFGCGGGVTFKYLWDNGAKITGCDNRSWELAQNINMKLDIVADIYKNLSEIKDVKFDLILALDVFEHVEKPRAIIKKLKELSHDMTKLIISGPTESLFYRIGRELAGFSGDYHFNDIYVIEGILKAQGLKNTVLINLYPPFPIFRVSEWSGL